MPGFLKQLFSGFSSSNGNVRFEQHDDLVRLAATHVAEDFPNPNTDDCPEPATITTLISAELLPSDDLREHMLMCSKCFDDYRRELANHRASKTVRATRAPLKTRLVPALAGGLAGALAVFALVVISDRFQDVGERMSLHPTPSPAGVSVAAGENSQPKPASSEPTAQQALSPRESSLPEQRESPSPLIAENRVSIDLENYDPLRGAVSSQPPPVRLRATRNELSMKLPAGSPQGTYTVNLSDPYGRALRSTNANSSDGVRLRLKLNLSSIEPGNYLICLTRQAEIPQCIPAVVKPIVDKK